MARQTFRSFFREAPLRARVTMVAVGLMAFLVAGSSLWTVFQLVALNRAARKLAKVADAPRKPAATVTAPSPADGRLLHPYEIRNFSLSVTDESGSVVSYVQFHLVLDCPSPESYRAMELNRARIRDAVITAALPFTRDELRSPQGSARFRKSLLAALQGEFGTNAPREVILDDFLVN